MQHDHLTERLDALPPERRLLIERLLKARAECRKEAESTKEEHDAYDPASPPLSFGQERIWIVDQLTPGSALFNEPIVLGLPSAIDARVLERTINEIVRRHDVLRAQFPAENGQPVQHIVPELLAPLPVTDVSGLPPSERERQVAQIIDQEARTPFDLTAEPLIRT